MKRANSRTTNLWQLIQNMQERMEAEGLSAEIVDAVVTRGLQRVLGRQASNENRRSRIPLGPLPQPG